MAVCGKRGDTPGFFTSCWQALGSRGCACGAEVEAELVEQAVQEDS